MKLSDNLRRTAVSICDGEAFDTGKPDHLMGVWLAEFAEEQFDLHTVERTELGIEAVTSDVLSHGLLKGSPITRVSDGKTYRVKRLEHSESGFTTIRLME